MTAWFEELDLDPASSWSRMGTRALGDGPWLVADERRAAELDLKAALLRTRRAEVLCTSDDSDAPARDVRQLVEGAGVTTPSDVGDDLEAAARSVQEDLCLLAHRSGSWYLDAACVCFPSRWRLRDKIHRPLLDVHGPTPGYRRDLDPRVSSLLDRIGERPVVRRNWFVHPDGSLHQPAAPDHDPIRPPEEVADGLHLRSERQTLRRLPSGWILFTIRTQHATLGDLLAEDEHRDRFVRYVRAAPPDELIHRGMAPAQVTAVRAWIATPELRIPGSKRDVRARSDTTSDS